MSSGRSFTSRIIDGSSIGNLVLVGNATTRNQGNQGSTNSVSSVKENGRDDEDKVKEKVKDDKEKVKDKEEVKIKLQKSVGDHHDAKSRSWGSTAGCVRPFLFYSTNTKDQDEWNNKDKAKKAKDGAKPMDGGGRGTALSTSDTREKETLHESAITMTSVLSNAKVDPTSSIHTSTTRPTRPPEGKKAHATNHNGEPQPPTNHRGETQLSTNGEPEPPKSAYADSLQKKYAHMKQFGVRLDAKDGISFGDLGHFKDFLGITQYENPFGSYPPASTIIIIHPAEGCGGGTSSLSDESASASGDLGDKNVSKNVFTIPITPSITPPPQDEHTNHTFDQSYGKQRPVSRFLTTDLQSAVPLLSRRACLDPKDYHARPVVLGGRGVVSDKSKTKGKGSTDVGIVGSSSSSTTISIGTGSTTRDHYSLLSRNRSTTQHSTSTPFISNTQSIQKKVIEKRDAGKSHVHVRPYLQNCADINDLHGFQKEQLRGLVRFLAANWRKLVEIWGSEEFGEQFRGQIEEEEERKREAEADERVRTFQKADKEKECVRERKPKHGKSTSRHSTRKKIGIDNLDVSPNITRNITASSSLVASPSFRSVKSGKSSDNEQLDGGIHHDVKSGVKRGIIDGDRKHITSTTATSTSTSSKGARTKATVNNGKTVAVKNGNQAHNGQGQNNGEVRQNQFEFSLSGPCITLPVLRAGISALFISQTQRKLFWRVIGGKEEILKTFWDELVLEGSLDRTEKNRWAAVNASDGRRNHVVKVNTLAQTISRFMTCGMHDDVTTRWNSENDNDDRDGVGVGVQFGDLVPFVMGRGELDDDDDDVGDEKGKMAITKGIAKDRNREQKDNRPRNKRTPSRSTAASARTSKTRSTTSQKSNISSFLNTLQLSKRKPPVSEETLRQREVEYILNSIKTAMTTFEDPASKAMGSRTQGLSSGSQGNMNESQHGLSLSTTSTRSQGLNTTSHGIINEIQGLNDSYGLNQSHGLSTTSRSRISGLLNRLGFGSNGKMGKLSLPFDGPFVKTDHFPFDLLCRGNGGKSHRSSGTTHRLSRHDQSSEHHQSSGGGMGSIIPVQNDNQATCKQSYPSSSKQTKLSVMKKMDVTHDDRSQPKSQPPGVPSGVPLTSKFRTRWLSGRTGIAEMSNLRPQMWTR